MYKRQVKITLVVNDKYIGIDESAPIVYPFKIETCLYALVTDLIQVVFEIGTIFFDGIKE